MVAPPLVAGAAVVVGAPLVPIQPFGSLMGNWCCMNLERDPSRDGQVSSKCGASNNYPSIKGEGITGRVSATRLSAYSVSDL